jgi:hypothetical protein
MNPNGHLNHRHTSGSMLIWDLYLCPYVTLCNLMFIRPYLPCKDMLILYNFFFIITYFFCVLYAR